MRNIGIAEGTVRKLLYTGHVCSAQEALQLGLVDEVVTYERLMPAAMDLAQRIASKARSALVLMKQGALTAAAHADWEAAYRATHHLSAQMTSSNEAKEGMNAFLEKRAAIYPAKQGDN